MKQGVENRNLSRKFSSTLLDGFVVWEARMEKEFLSPSTLPNWSEAFSQTLPASTWLGAESLALEGMLIEVDAVAVVEGSQIAASTP